MRSSCLQILDLREPQIRVAWSLGSAVEVGEAVDLDSVGVAEPDWLEAVDEALTRIPLQRHRTVLILPLRVLLFKIVRVPDVDGRKLRRLLRFEVERAFPHEPDQLVWGHHRIWNDGFEGEVLLAAMHRTSLESLSTNLEQRGVPSVAAIPSLFIALDAVSDLDVSSGLHHCICLEEAQGCLLSQWETGTQVIPFSFRQPHALRSIQPCHSGRAALLENALQKAGAALHRNVGAVDCGGFEWSAALQDGETRNSLESIATRALQASPEVQHCWIDLSPQAIACLVARGDPTQMLRLPVPNASRSASAWQRRLQAVAGVLMALAPLLWVAGNERAIGQYSSALEADRQRMAEQRAQAEAAAAEMDSIETRLAAFEAAERDRLRQDALLQLFEDLQQAMLSVGDTWFEEFEFELSGAEGAESEPLLTLEGKFLLRQSHLTDEQWQRAMADAELNLQRLQQAVMASTRVDSIEQFRVSFSGIHHRIPVVPFKLRVVLAPPFAALSAPAREVAP